MIFEDTLGMLRKLFLDPQFQNHTFESCFSRVATPLKRLKIATMFFSFDQVKTNLPILWTQNWI